MKPPDGKVFPGQIDCLPDIDETPALRQPSKTPFMAAKVIVREGESLDIALQRFQKSVNLAYHRQFYTKRIGCYEKLSDRLRRQKQAGRRRERLRQRLGDDRSLPVYIHLRGLHSRGEDPFRS